MRKSLAVVTIFLVLLLSSLISYRPTFQFVNAQQTQQSLTTTPSPNGLMAYWKLNEGKGTAISDSSSNNFRGTINGASWITKQGNNYLDFNGESSYVSLPSMDFTSLTSFSVVAWINSDLTKTGFIMYHGNLGEFEFGNGDLSQETQTLNLNATHASFGVKLSDYNWYSIQSVPMEPNVWHQVVGVWEKGISLKVYVDGVLAAENSNMPQLSLFNPGESFPNSLGIYSQNRWGITDFFKGQINNVMVFNNALTPQKIYDIYVDTSLPEPTLNASCESSISQTNLKVQINGDLSFKGVGIANAAVLLSYSVTNGASWQDLTGVHTGADGAYSALWFPEATGDYMLKAIYQGDADYLSATKVMNFSIVPCTGQSVFSVTSNSTLSAFVFDSTSKELSFSVSGDNGTNGYVNVYVPNSLMTDVSGLKVSLDNQQIDYTAQHQGDGWMLYFTYHHSSHLVKISLAANGASSQLLMLGFTEIAILIVLGIILAVVAVVVFVSLSKKNKN
jgi:hypothetical protein